MGLGSDNANATFIEAVWEALNSGMAEDELIDIIEMIKSEREESEEADE